MATTDRTAALEELKTVLERLDATARKLGAVTTAPDDPYAGLAACPALERLEVGKGILEEDQLADILKKVEEAKTSNERFAEVVAFRQGRSRRRQGHGLTPSSSHSAVSRIAG